MRKRSSYLNCFILPAVSVLKSYLYRELKMEYKKLKEKVKEYNKKDAKFYSNMLAKMLEPHVSSSFKKRVTW